MKNEVYIGVNGIGKTKELKKQNDNLSKKQKNIFWIQYSNKESAPDSNVLTNKNIVFDQFKKFIKSLFTFKEQINFKELDKELQEKFSDKWEKVNSEDKLKTIWNKMLEDPFVDFVRKEKNNDEISTIITSAKKSETEKPENCDFSIEKRLYDLNLEKWKQATEKGKKGIESYGTGKLSYFQIKFIYSHLELIENREDSYLIIDEPEVFLHPSLVKKMGFMLKEIGKKINVIIATHSATFLNAFYDPNVTEIFSKKNYSDLWIEIKIKKPYVFTSRQQCFEALMAKKIIILEGSNDYKLIEYIINNEELEDYDIYICIAKGKSEITSMINIFKGITIKDNTNKMWHKFENDFFILYDKDESVIEKGGVPSEDHKKWNSEIKNSSKENKIKIYGFKNNLEKYFDDIKKDELDPENFFKEKTKKEKLNKFLEKSEINKFLKGV